MTDKEVEEQLTALFMSDEMTKIAAACLLRWLKEQELYGDYFQRIYGPNETPPKRYGWSGEEI